MENLAFVIWMVCYPVASAAVSYLSDKSRMITKQRPYDDGVKAFSSFINIIIWIAVGANLYK